MSKDMIDWNARFKLVVALLCIICLSFTLYKVTYSIKGLYEKKQKDKIREANFKRLLGMKKLYYINIGTTEKPEFKIINDYCSSDLIYYIDESGIKAIQNSILFQAGIERQDFIYFFGEFTKDTNDIQMLLTRGIVHEKFKVLEEDKPTDVHMYMQFK